MGKMVWGWAAVLGAVLCGAPAWAEGDPAKAPPDAEPPAAAAAPAPSQTADPQKETDAAAQLNGTAWEIQLVPMPGEPSKRPLKDVLKFQGGTVTAERLASDGHPASNYTLTVGDDGIPVWETMQTVEGKGVVFWRGEVYGDRMSGILSKHPLEGAAQDFSFSGRSMSAADQPPPAPAQVDAAPAQQPAPQEGEPKPKKKKKKGWW